MTTPARSILLTGFEPFNGSTLNPSQRIIETLAERGDSLGVALHTALLPVDTARVAEVLLPLLDELRPMAVVHVGEAAKAEKVRVERLAVNLLDFDCADNAGAVIRDAAIEPGGPAARWATLDVRAAERAVVAAGVPVALSMSAGTYLCNQTLYLSLHWAARVGGDRRVGFVHVPSLPEQVALGQRPGPGMAQAQSIAAVEAVLGSIVGR